MKFMEERFSKESIDEIDASLEQEALRKLEAALFVAGRFLNVQELVTLTDLNPIIIKKMLSDLKDKYENSGISIINRDKLWKMDVAEEFLDIVNRLATGSAEFSKAEQETLAMIAFKQPMKQSVLIKIRGNKAYDHIKKFKDLGLIFKKKAGHTYELNLAEEFYDYFHLNKGEDLNKLNLGGE